VDQALKLLADAVSRLRIARYSSESFKPRAQWEAFEYRDLGIAEASNGKVGAFHMRAKGPCRGEQGWHYHALDFHMVYILRGCVTYLWQGAKDPIVAKAGACLFQPPREAHNVIDYSSDLEVLEITMPAEYETVTIIEG
jgi:quercetin dioxygenase-like cupin family protein